MAGLESHEWQPQPVPQPPPPGAFRGDEPDLVLAALDDPAAKSDTVRVTFRELQLGHATTAVSSGLLTRSSKLVSQSMHW
ncbi:MAG TPA: hypothetical protein VMT52_12470 [Planctomycetota bacterium]|nr:hypothetical protein [Planctomycetota bacterium]